jgi:hypothetical protein
LIAIDPDIGSLTDKMMEIITAAFAAAEAE